MLGRGPRPGVERSGTPGAERTLMSSPWNGRQRKRYNLPDTHHQLALTALNEATAAHFALCFLFVMRFPFRLAVYLTLLIRRRDRRLSLGLLFAILVLSDSLRQGVTRALILIACLGEADPDLSIGEYLRNYRLQFVINQRVQTEPARQRQVQMVLQATPEVCELNGINRSSYTTVLVGMQFFFAGVDEYSVAVNIALIVYWFVWLPAIVESDWVGPHVLPALAQLLAIVLPMNTMPIKIILYAMLEASPDCGARIGRGGVDHD